jgi:chromosome segregation ATPase
MAIEQNQNQELDLEKTDRLPVLTADYDPDFADDAVRMDGSPGMNAVARLNSLDTTAERPALSEGFINAPALASSNLSSDFIRPSPVDLPSLAETLRAVEERIAHQQAEYEVLSRSFARARDSEEAAKLRAGELDADLSAVRELLEAEQARTREQEKNLTERAAVMEAARNRADEALDKARGSEEAARLRASQFEADLNALRIMLESEQTRTREQERSLEERTLAAEAARSRAEAALLETERHQSESRLLKDSLAARDATIVQVLHSLGERDAQLASLQQELANVQRSFDARSKSGTQLEADLNSAKLAVQELSTQLAASKDSIGTLTAKLKRSASEVDLIRSELGSARTESASYLELLRTREYRRGFDENQFMELDARVGVADAIHDALKQECNRLLAEAANRDLQIAAQSAAVEQLQSSVSTQTATIAQQAHDLKQIESARAQLDERLSVAEAKLKQVTAELADREAALTQTRQSASADSERMSALLSSAEQRHAEQSAQFAQLHAELSAGMTKMQSEHATAMSEIQAEHAAAMSDMQTQHASVMSQIHTDHAAKVAHMRDEHMAQLADWQSTHSAAAARAETERTAQLSEQKALYESYIKETEEQLRQREQEMSVLMAHLQEARRPIEPIEAEVTRLSQELTAKTAAFGELEAEADKLRTALERTRGALEEREFLIRRLERSESNNANVLGRIQTSMERLGSAPIVAAPLSTVPDWSAELVRTDGGRNITHTLGRRTRIGRGVGCELQVDSSSVSRHHALIVMGPRDTIIEDLNSTNGVLLNGRKITRAFLTDGDTVIVGEVQFRYVAKQVHRTAAQQQALEAAPLN